MRFQRRMSALVTSLVLCGCTTAVEPPIDPSEIEVDFSSEVTRADTLPLVHVEAGGGTVFVEGRHGTANGGHELRPELMRVGDRTYELRVSAVSVGGGVTMPISYVYRAGLTGWPPGRYRFRVVIEDEWGEAFEVFDELIYVL